MCVRHAVTRRWMGALRQWINTPNSLSFIHSSLGATDVAARWCFHSHGAMWFYFCLFVLSFPSLSWVDSETRCARTSLSLRGWRTPLRGCRSSVVQATGWFDPPIVNLEINLWPLEKHWSEKTSFLFPTVGFGAAEEAIMSSRIDESLVEGEYWNYTAELITSRLFCRFGMRSDKFKAWFPSHSWCLLS